ncbi:MAG: O-antigen ligase family protein [Candidatus Acidiferrales bacterium]
MPPFVALALWFVLLVALLLWDPAKDPTISSALWVPVIWMFIVGSRLPAQWLGGSVETGAQALEEGNPIDRAVFFVLILLAVLILMSRSFNWGQFFARNMALMAFVLFGLVSVLWSDSTLVSFKRWFRDLGPYVVVLVVLSDMHPLEAVRTLFRRLCYLLIPLSIVLIKYFPYLGKHYSEWTGAAEFSGAATSKNLLGVMCLVSALFFFWDTLTRWPNRKERSTKRIIAVNFVFIAMTLWLFNLAHSATSDVCLMIGSLVIVIARSKWAQRHPGFLKVLIPVSFCLYLIVGFGFDLNGELASLVGRDPTLTDRTAIWKLVLSMHTNPIVGTGYESFWLGPRLQQIWKMFGPINEAHNGYLEVYLNLGLVGVFLLCGLLIAAYRKIGKQLTTSPALAQLNLAIWTIMLFYNMTEAGFRSGLMWITFLLGAMAVPARVEERAPSFRRLEKPRLEAMSRPSFGTTGSRR